MGIFGKILGSVLPGLSSLIPFKEGGVVLTRKKGGKIVITKKRKAPVKKRAPKRKTRARK